MIRNLINVAKDGKVIFVNLPKALRWIGKLLVKIKK
jgi:hypothetical protein